MMRVISAWWEAALESARTAPRRRRMGGGIYEEVEQWEMGTGPRGRMG